MPNPTQGVVAAPAAPQTGAIVKSILNADTCKAKFAEVLGKKAPGFISSVIQVSNLPTLAGADPKTVVNAAMVAATLDLPINNNLGFAYIVPYNDKRMGKQAQFQMGYKGFIQLAQRSGQYRTINATDVREGEIVSEDMLSGEITFRKLPASQRASAKVIGYVAFFELLNGFRKTLYATREEIDAHAKQYSQSYKYDKYNTSLWATQFDAMARKTVIKLLLSKYGPLTIDMQRAQQFDQAAVTADPVASTGIDDIAAEDVLYCDNQPEDDARNERDEAIARAEAEADAQQAQQQANAAPAKPANAPAKPANAPAPAASAAGASAARPAAASASNDDKLPY